jgi:hypothetical protein
MNVKIIGGTEEDEGKRIEQERRRKITTKMRRRMQRRFDLCFLIILTRK